MVFIFHFFFVDDGSFFTQSVFRLVTRDDRKQGLETRWKKIHCMMAISVLMQDIKNLFVGSWYIILTVHNITQIRNF